MKANVLEDRCIGCGQCEATLPNVFQIGDEGIATVVGEVNENNIEDAKLAASGCPTDAIEIKEA